MSDKIWTYDEILRDACTITGTEPRNYTVNPKDWENHKGAQLGADLAQATKRQFVIRRSGTQLKIKLS